jgi:type I restriction enzyme S subunit
MITITTPFPVVSFDRIFERVDREIMVAELEEYSCLGVRLEGRGAYIREVRQGSSIKRKRQSVVCAGDVLYNKLFAWRGAFAVADRSVDGCIASDKFPLYRADIGQVDTHYLEYWFRTRHLAAQARQHSKGAAALSKLTLNPPDFWKLWIPLPDLTEQRRIARRLDRFFEVLNSIMDRREPIDAVVQGRRAGIGSEVRLMMSAALERLNTRYAEKLGVLDEALTLRPRSGPSFACTNDGPGMAVVMPSALGGFRYDSSKVMFGAGTERINDNDVLQRDDLLISRGNKRDQVGLCIVYDDEDNRRTHANLLMRMRTRADVLPHFVKYWIMSPLAVRYIRKHTKGTSPSVQKINQRDLINMPFPRAVPVPEQQGWVQWLDRVFDRVEDIEGLIREQYEDIRKMPDATLTAAFKGEL